MNINRISFLQVKWRWKKNGAGDYAMVDNFIKITPHVRIA